MPDTRLIEAVERLIQVTATITAAEASGVDMTDESGAALSEDLADAYADLREALAAAKQTPEAENEHRAHAARMGVNVCPTCGSKHPRWCGEPPRGLWANEYSCPDPFHKQTPEQDSMHKALTGRPAPNGMDAPTLEQDWDTINQVALKNLAAHVAPTPEQGERWDDVGAGGEVIDPGDGGTPVPDPQSARWRAFRSLRLNYRWRGVYRWLVGHNHRIGCRGIVWLWRDPIRVEREQRAIAEGAFL